MWTKEARIQHAPREQRYPSDVTDAEWTIIAPMIPPQRIHAVNHAARAWPIAALDQAA